MHDIRLIRDDPSAFDAGLARRGLAPLSASLLAMDDRRRAAIAALQQAQERRNALSKEIGKAMAAKDVAAAEGLKAEVAALKDATPGLEAAEKAMSGELDAALAAVPNTPLADVPDGKDEHDNVEHHRHGERPEARADRLAAVNAPRQHFELGEALGDMDFEAAAKLSGARFVVLKRHLARLERALGQFMLDLHVGEHGYSEVSPPLLVRDEIMFGTAQLPKFEEDQFAAVNLTELAAAIVGTPGVFENYGSLFDEIEHQDEKSDQHLQRLGTIGGRLQQAAIAAARRFGRKFWLIPTAEVPLTNLVRESILSEDELPLRFTALTPCFRAEAGAAGRDTRGMLRQHQFAKVELVSVTHPEASPGEHERMLACAEAVLKGLDLHYRVVTLCTGDMGFAAAKTYDIEVWLPGQAAYREVSSCSVCGDFQARRMNARFRPKEGKGPRFVHTLNGSGVALGRALIAVMENYQNGDGSITVPPVLVPYMDGMTRIEKAT